MIKNVFYKTAVAFVKRRAILSSSAAMTAVLSMVAVRTAPGSTTQN